MPGLGQHLAGCMRIESEKRKDMRMQIGIKLNE
jgi:hypothetical protein